MLYCFKAVKGSSLFKRWAINKEEAIEIKKAKTNI